MARTVTAAQAKSELKGAFRSPSAARHIRNIEYRVLPALTVIPYDLEVARVYGAIQAHLEDEGRVLADADLQIAASERTSATATGRHHSWRRVPKPPPRLPTA